MYKHCRDETKHHLLVGVKGGSTTIDSVSAKQCVAHADAVWLVIVQDECSPALSHSSAKGNYFVFDAAGPLITTGTLLLSSLLGTGRRPWERWLGGGGPFRVAAKSSKSARAESS